MSVIRVERNKNFTHMANYHLRDKTLSLRAVGLMSRMLSLKDDWCYSVTGLASICKEGREAVRKVLQELEAAGYLTREQSRDGGHFAGYDYTLHEEPQGRDPARCPDFWATESPPLPRIPVPGNPVPENPPQSNTKESSTEDIPPKAPQGAGADFVPKTAPDWKPERFAAFWKFYPLHKSKQACIRAWDKLKPSDELLIVIGRALKRQIAEEEARAEREHRPFEWKLHASTYLNQARWTDEPDRPARPTKPAGFSGWADEPEASA